MAGVRGAVGRGIVGPGLTAADATGLVGITGFGGGAGGTYFSPRYS